jgi:hypothetical protein
MMMAAIVGRALIFIAYKFTNTSSFKLMDGCNGEGEDRNRSPCLLYLILRLNHSTTVVWGQLTAQMDE